MRLLWKIEHLSTRAFLGPGGVLDVGVRVGSHPTVLKELPPELADDRNWTLEREGVSPRAGGASHARPVRRILLRTASDERLAQLAGAGDRRAFEAIIGRYGPSLLAHCRGIAKDSGQDAVQEALMSAWRALQRGEQVRDLRAWLFTIAHRAALQMLRDQGSPTESLSDVAGGRSPEEQTEQSTRLRSVLAALAGLPPRERDALVWTSIHGRSGRDAAGTLGVSEDTLRQLTYRARTRARAAMGAFVPPAARLAALAGHALRRAGSTAHRAWASAGHLAPAGKLVGLYPLLATAALVGAPVAALERHGARHVHAPARASATRVELRRPSATRASGQAPRAPRTSERGPRGRGPRTVTVRSSGFAHAAGIPPSGSPAASATIAPAAAGGRPSGIVLSAGLAPLGSGSAGVVAAPPSAPPAPVGGGTNQLTSAVQGARQTVSGAVQGLAGQALQRIEALPSATVNALQPVASVPLQGSP